MHNFFHPHRFAKLFIKQTTEHYRLYIMSIAVLTGVMVLGGSFLFFVTPGPIDSGMQTALYVSLLLLAGTIFTSTIFSDLGIPSRAMPALTLPASSFEKYLVAWLYTYPVFIIIFTGIFYLVLAILSLLKRSGPHPFQFMNLAKPELLMLVVFYSILHAVSIVGAIVFDKMHFIKTGFVFFIGYGLVVIANTIALRGVTGIDISPALPFAYLNFHRGEDYYSLGASVSASGWVAVSMLVAAVLVSMAAYYKLKEKQV